MSLRQSKPESLWPARIVILSLIGLNVVLSDYLSLGPSWLLPSLEFLLLAPLSVLGSKERHRLIRVGHQDMDWSQGTRILTFVMIGLLYITNLASLVLLVHSLIKGSSASGGNLLADAVNIWFTNILVFSIWYWEMDQGGPLRRGEGVRFPDFQFPQSIPNALIPPDWRPEYLDYMFVAFTNAIAFSPTDTMPLTRRSKVLMTIQASTSMITILLVASRAVNILK